MTETKPTGVFAIIPIGMRTSLHPFCPLTPDGLGSSKRRDWSDGSVKESAGLLCCRYTWCWTSRRTSVRWRSLTWRGQDWRWWTGSATRSVCCSGSSTATASSKCSTCRCSPPVHLFSLWSPVIKVCRLQALRRVDSLILKGQESHHDFNS